MKDQQPIGIFDSGIGGLTIARALKMEMPNENICYFGDTKHLPYGEKSSESIKQYSLKIADFLLKENCKAIVIACNSASTSASLELNRKYKDLIPIINVIDPTVEYIGNSGFKNVGLIGTKRTVSSQAYAKRLRAINQDIKLYSRATPLLAPMVEEGFYNNQISKTVINSYLNYDRFSGIEALILGCTHYPLIISEIQDYYSHKVKIIDSSIVTAKKVKSILEDNNLLTRNKGDLKDDVFYVSEFTESFEQSAQQFFGSNVKLKEANLFRA